MNLIFSFKQKSAFSFFVGTSLEALNKTLKYIHKISRRKINASNNLVLQLYKRNSLKRLSFKGNNCVISGLKLSYLYLI